MPCYIGNLIYTYARDHMLKIYQYGGVYGDTDSLQMSTSAHKKLMEENPKLMGKEFG